MNAPLAIQKPTLAPLEFTPEQRKIILDSFLNGASAAEAAVLMELAKIRRLNPITRQIHFVKRWNANRNCETWEAQVGIDGFRTIAERTGLYDGQDEAEFGYNQAGNQLVWCKVRVYRKDWSRPAVGLAHYAEYVQKKKDGAITKMWAEKPHVMLAKCAEAIAFRRGFPDDTSGLYTAEEMPEVETVERAVNNPPPATSQPALQPSNGVPPSVPSSSQTEKVAAKVKAAAAEKARTAGAPRGLIKCVFGPSKGKMISDLTVAELNAAITFGEQKLSEAPSAEWAASVAAGLADLKQDHSDRIERAIDAEAAEKAAKPKTAEKPEPGSAG